MYIQNMVLLFFEYIAVLLFMNYYEIDDRQIKVFDILLCITIFCVMIYGFMCYILGVNPFDRPGVEAYKKNMFRLLGKPGY